MRYLRVKNWEKLQHQSDKPLPWIKFFTALLAPTKEPCYSEWPDATKALLHHLWLMARVFNNRIPETWLTREKLNLKSRVNLDPLIASGFIWFETEDGKQIDSGIDASRTRDARSGISNSQSKKSSFTGVEGVSPGFDQEAAFESVWSDYPRPLGRKKAESYFAETVKSEDDLARIRRALAHYRGSGDVQRGFVMHGKTWFNNWHEWENYDDKYSGNGNKNGHAIHTGTASGGPPLPRAGDAQPQRRMAAEFGQRNAADILAAQRADGEVPPVSGEPTS